jgi:serine phosphatase RsbU (regulator of sigma subunit)
LWRRINKLAQAIVENRHLSAPEMSSALNDALREFVDAAPQFDDIAVVVVKRI